MLGWLYWNPTREAFTIPFIDRPIVWYGIIFAFGFMVGYLILIPMIKEHLQITRKQSMALVDRINLYVVAGTVIGARLGHVFFYDWGYYKQHPIDIFKVWEGGLASHGGTLGVIFALFLVRQSIKKTYPQLTFLSLLDLLTVPVAFVAFCIRMGNFMNQEIVGTATSVPWGIIFGNPFEGGPIVPRHPVQLYEGICYLITFFTLMILWRKKRNTLKPGQMTGLFFLLVFGTRFIVEYWKVDQGGFATSQWLQTGQFLSIPFIIFGSFLFLKGNLRTRKSF